MANDIFRERVTLRGVEGDTRVVPLAELKQELEQAARRVGGGARGRGAGARSRAGDAVLEERDARRVASAARPPPLPGPHARRARTATASRDAASGAAGRRGGRRGRRGRTRRRRRRPRRRDPPAKRRVAWPRSTSPPRSTTPTAIRTSATPSRRSAPMSSRAITACSATTSISSSAWTSTGRRSRRPRPSAGVTPQAARRRGRGDASRRCGSGSAISNDQFIRTTAPRAQARACRRSSSASSSSQPGRLLREVVRGLVLRRLRGVQAGRRDRRRQVRAAPDARRSSGWRSATGSSG